MSYCVGPPPEICGAGFNDLCPGHRTIESRSVGVGQLDTLRNCGYRRGVRCRGEDDEGTPSDGSLRQSKFKVELGGRSVALARELLKARSRQNAEVASRQPYDALVLELLGRQSDTRPVRAEQGRHEIMGDLYRVGRKAVLAQEQPAGQALFH